MSRMEILAMSSKAAGQTCVLTVVLITVVRAVIFSITTPGQTDTAPWFTAELVSCAYRCSWGTKKKDPQISKKDQKRPNSKANSPKHSFLSAEAEHFHYFPALTAVPLIWLVITVEVSITPPASINAQATVAHEFSRATRLVRCCRDGKE